jgi:hypothetical protein
MKLRRDLNVSLKEDKQKWQAIRSPCCLHAANMTLDEMLAYIPQAEQEQFHEIGDGYVYMPLFTMEKYLFPTLNVMRYLHEFTAQMLPGGVESMIAYSFFNPRNRAQYDIDVLKNSTFSAGRDIPQQLQSSAEVTEDAFPPICVQRLDDCAKQQPFLISTNWMVMIRLNLMNARLKSMLCLIKIYSNQVSADYTTCRLEKEKLIMLSHLSQQQSMEVLEVSLRLAQVMGANQTQLKTIVEDDLLRTVSEMEAHIQTMLNKNRDIIRNAVREVSDSITPYSVSDMDNVLTSQKKLMDDVIAKNALLVSENSELRMHMSFMPVEYWDYVKNLQKSNHQEYRNQRKTPQVIIPETDHKDGGSIEMGNAPMTTLP